MTEPIVFTVYGVAQPQGSARAFTYQRKPEKGGGIGARVDSDNPKLKSWRRDVALAAREVFRGAPLAGPVRIVAECYLPRPQRLRGDRAHVTRPDVDKVARGLADSLTGVVYRDDSQITQFKITKAYTAAGERPRAVIAVTPLTEEGRLFS